MPGGEYVVVNATFGRNLTYEGVLKELNRIRANRGVHSITFESLQGGRRLTVNAYMGIVRQAHVGYDSCGKIISSSITVPFIQVDTPTILYPMRFKLRGIIDVRRRLHQQDTVRGRHDIPGRWVYPGPGRRSRADTHPDIEWHDRLPGNPGRLRQWWPQLMVNQVLGTDLDFAAGDQIDIDVDEIPAGGLSKDAIITVWCWLFRP